MKNSNIQIASIDPHIVCKICIWKVNETERLFLRRTDFLSDKSLWDRFKTKNSIFIFPHNIFPVGF
jgi:hypothetical protein